MRTDLTTDFITAAAASGSSPRTLAVFKFEQAGTVYLSDQLISLGGVTYQALVNDWGTLDEAGNPEELTSEIRQQTITIINSGTPPFTDYFLTEPPENTIVEIYQWFDGLGDEDKALIDRFFIQDPIEFGESSQTVRIDLVSLGMGYDSYSGPLLTKANWPDARPEDIGKGIPLIVGNPGKVKTLVGWQAKQATLDGPIVENSTTIQVKESLSGWRDRGSIQIDEEIISYSSRDDNKFFVAHRGREGTVPADHQDGAAIIERITTHTYIVGREVDSISAVFVGGRPVSASEYTVDTNPRIARIFFQKKPNYIGYSQSTSNVDIDFDAITGSNTAIAPGNAYDGKPSTEAVINETSTTLALKQVDANPDEGQIVRAFLKVEHWANDFYTNDRAAVWVQGQGVIGYLDRPSSRDEVNIDAEVDIDHPHDHRTGDVHTHNFNNPGYSAQVGNHAHALTGTTEEVKLPAFGVGFPLLVTGLHTGTKTQYFTHSIPDGVVSSAYCLVRAYVSGCELKMYEGSGFRAGWERDGYVEQEVQLTPPVVSRISFRLIGKQNYGSSVRFDEVTLFITYSQDMEPAKSAVVPYLSSSGNNVKTYNTNKDDDVNPLRTANRTVDVVTERATKTIQNDFDLTNLFQPSWSWFTNREVKIIYTGTNDNVNIFITEAKFEVAIKKRQVIYSDDVTCVPHGKLSSRPSDIIYYLLSTVGGVPDSYIDLTSFDAARNNYVSLGYALNGIINAESKIKESINNILKQSRSRMIWTAGKAKLVLREFLESWTIDKSISTSNLQFKSISARRQKLADIVNDLEILYDKDWTKEEGTAAYKEIASAKDQRSISSIRNIEQREGWNFDLVRTQNMANDLANFYLERLKTPSTFYTFNCYLEQFDVEKEDKVEVTSGGFNQMVKIPTVVRASNRIYGSSETGQINLIQFVVESLRNIKLAETIEEAVLVSDAISVLIGLLLDFEDSVSTQDEIQLGFGKIFSDSLLVSDLLLIVAIFDKTISETITIGENIAIDYELNLSEDIIVTEEIIFTTSFGYGSGAYGVQAGYGGILDLGQRNSEDLAIADTLAFDLSAVESDTVSIADEIAASDGYGSPKLGDGYGETPFGDPT